MLIEKLIDYLLICCVKWIFQIVLCVSFFGNWKLPAYLDLLFKDLCHYWYFSLKRMVKYFYKLALYERPVRNINFFYWTLIEMVQKLFKFLFINLLVAKRKSWCSSKYICVMKLNIRKMLDTFQRIGSTFISSCRTPLETSPSPFFEIHSFSNKWINLNNRDILIKNIWSLSELEVF